MSVMGVRMPQWWPWRLRETLLIILGLVVILAMWNTRGKMPTDIVQPETENSRQTLMTAEDEDRYTRQIATYLEGRQKGLTQEQIAKKIFKVSDVHPRFHVTNIIQHCENLNAFSLFQTSYWR